MKKIMKLMLVGLMSLMCVACSNEVTYKMTRFRVVGNEFVTAEESGIFGNLTIEKKESKFTFELYNEGEEPEVHACTFEADGEQYSLHCPGFADGALSAAVRDDNATLTWRTNGQMMQFMFEKQ